MLGKSRCGSARALMSYPCCGEGILFHPNMSFRHFSRSTASYARMKLPQLSDIPAQHPDCCCSLPKTLITKIASLLPTELGLALSIGSGTGLLEALLLDYQSTMNLRAVEVSKAVNKYLPGDLMETVNGTWDLCKSTHDAGSWIFVYPRETGLIKRYAQVCGQSSIKQVIWIGPLADLNEIQDSYLPPTIWKREIVNDCGLSDYETMILWTRLDLKIE